MKSLVYNNTVDYDYMVVDNFNRISLFKYKARFRIKRDLRDKIFLNTLITKNINTINEHLKAWQVVAVKVKTIGNVDLYHIITNDKYLKNQNANKKFLKYDLPEYNKRILNHINYVDNKEETKTIKNCTIDLSDLD